MVSNISTQTVIECRWIYSKIAFLTEKNLNHNFFLRKFEVANNEYKSYSRPNQHDELYPR